MIEPVRTYRHCACGCLAVVFGLDGAMKVDCHEQATEVRALHCCVCGDKPSHDVFCGISCQKRWSDAQDEASWMRVAAREYAVSKGRE